MSDLRTHRVLVVTDPPDTSQSLRDGIRHRAEAGDVKFRLIVLNPARAELHLLHPERHERAAEAEAVLRSALPQLEDAAHAPVIGSVSGRHDPMGAIEETLSSEAVAEIILDVPPHHFSSWLRQDLEHRLAHFHTPVLTIRHGLSDHPA